MPLWSVIANDKRTLGDDVWDLPSLIKKPFGNKLGALSSSSSSLLMKVVSPINTVTDDIVNLSSSRRTEYRLPCCTSDTNQCRDSCPKVTNTLLGTSTPADLSSFLKVCEHKHLSSSVTRFSVTETLDEISSKEYFPATSFK